MSRSYCSYNEDWQRRKSTLIRSLFHDIPILSPVPEESNESIIFNSTKEIPPQHRDEDDRPESPLPPLIIEKAPNRHDEPEEYYNQLLKKIRRIYRKLFIENKDVTVEDLILNSCDSSINDAHFDMTGDNYDNDASDNFNGDLNYTRNQEQDNRNFDSSDDNRESSDSINSNGYGPDSELSTSDTIYIEVENHSKSKGDEPMEYEEEEISEEQEISEPVATNDLAKGQIKEITESYKATDETDKESSNTVYIDVENLSNSKEDEPMRCEEEESIDEQETSETVNTNDLTKDRTKGTTESYNASDETDKESSICNTVYIDVENLSNSNEDEPMRCEEEELSDEQEISETVNTNDLAKTWIKEIAESCTAVDGKHSTQVDEPLHLSISDKEMNENEQPNNTNTENEQSDKNTESSKIMEHPENIQDIEVDNEEIDKNGKPNNVVSNHEESELKSHKREQRICNENDCIESRVEVIQEDIETNSASDGTDYMQITTKALVHVDGYQDAVERESRVYEESIKSLILPIRQFRRHITARNYNHEDTIEELSALEENEDPDTTFNSENSVVSDNVTEPMEVMRTPQPKISNEFVPATAPSQSDITDEYADLPQHTEIASVTLASDDCNNDISKPKTSDEMNDILTSIFNESQNEAIKSPPRKRKLYEDISVQTTQKVTWDEIRGNLFFGTPKIFRLCACADHICN